jgi:hypothetical protein
MTSSRADSVLRALRFALRPDLAALRALVWAATALRALRPRLRSEGLLAHVVAPPALPPNSVRAVAWLLDTARASCLERALILQSWLSSQGQCHEVLIGVSRRDGFSAHAWLDGFDDAEEVAHYEVLERVAPS